MRAWKEIQLREISSDISYGFTASATSENIGPKLLRITDISNGRINWKNVPHCKISDKDFYKYKLSAGDIVIARTGATTGYNAIIKNDVNAVFASYLIRFQIDKKLANPFFVGHILQSTKFQEYVNSIAGGSAQPGANAQQFADFEFSLPSLPEQTAIAEILGSLNDKIDLLHRQNKTLEQLVESLFRQWFVEEAEEGWEETTINEISSNIQYGFTQSSKLEKIGPKFLRITDIQGGSIDWHSVPYCLIHENEKSKYLLKTGDIVVARTGTSTGENTYLHKPYEAVFASYLIRLQFSNIFIARYVGVLMRMPEYRNYIDGILSGSAQPNANANELTSFRMQIPPLNKLEKFYDIIIDFDEKQHKNRNQILILNQLRDSLLPKLMSGEIRVN